jgi:hypothetical protein
VLRVVEDAEGLCVLLLKASCLLFQAGQGVCQISIVCPQGCTPSFHVLPSLGYHIALLASCTTFLLQDAELAHKEASGLPQGIHLQMWCWTGQGSDPGTLVDGSNNR